MHGDGDALHLLTEGLLDDAAVFPPGLAELADAIEAHRRYRHAWFAPMVGPLVLPAAALDGFITQGGDVPVSLTFAQGADALTQTLRAADAAGVVVAGVEVAVGQGEGAAAAIESIGAEVAQRDDAVKVSVELERGHLSSAALDLLREHGMQAKIRVGGIQARMYPDELELAHTIRLIVDSKVPFKATAGLHRAVRNTHAHEGFEQHGFLNLLLATVAGMDGADETELVDILADRDEARIADRLGDVGSAGVQRGRQTFRSFGTCSVMEPIDDLRSLGLVAGQVADLPHPESERQHNS